MCNCASSSPYGTVQLPRGPFGVTSPLIDNLLDGRYIFAHVIAATSRGEVLRARCRGPPRSAPTMQLLAESTTMEAP